MAQYSDSYHSMVEDDDVVALHVSSRDREFLDGSGLEENFSRAVRTSSNAAISAPPSSIDLRAVDPNDIFPSRGLVDAAPVDDAPFDAAKTAAAPIDDEVVILPAPPPLVLVMEPVQLPVVVVPPMEFREVQELIGLPPLPPPEYVAPRPQPPAENAAFAAKRNPGAEFHIDEDQRPFFLTQNRPSRERRRLWRKVAREHGMDAGAFDNYIVGKFGVEAILTGGATRGRRFRPIAPRPVVQGAGPAWVRPRSFPDLPMHPLIAEPPDLLIDLTTPSDAPTTPPPAVATAPLAEVDQGPPLGTAPAPSDDDDQQPTALNFFGPVQPIPTPRISEGRRLAETLTQLATVKEELETLKAELERREGFDKIKDAEMKRLRAENTVLKSYNQTWAHSNRRWHPETMERIAKNPLPPRSPSPSSRSPTPPPRSPTPPPRSPSPPPPPPLHPPEDDKAFRQMDEIFPEYSGRAQ